MVEKTTSMDGPLKFVITEFDCMNSTALKNMSMLTNINLHMTEEFKTNEIIITIIIACSWLSL